jgi:hypothetical protein
MRVENESSFVPTSESKKRNFENSNIEKPLFEQNHEKY